MAANQVYLQNGSQYIATATNVSVAVTSTVSTVAAVELGCRRVLSNQSTGTNVYMQRQSSTGSTTQCIVLFPSTNFIDEFWNGAVYLVTTTGTTATVGVETIKYQVYTT
jgi:hypothetical protein